VAGAIALAASLGFGAAYGALNVASWLSYFATLFFIAAYLLISFGLIRYIWRDYRNEFSWLKHFVLPIISIVAMGWVLWGNIHPYPPAPLRWFIYATIGVILASIGMAHWLESKRPDAMTRAGMLLSEVELEEEAAIEGRPEPVVDPSRVDAPTAPGPTA
jgi:amino acid transporter